MLSPRMTYSPSGSCSTGASLPAQALQIIVDRHASARAARLRADRPQTHGRLRATGELLTSNTLVRDSPLAQCSWSGQSPSAGPARPAACANVGSDTLRAASTGAVLASGDHPEPGKHGTVRTTILRPSFVMTETTSGRSGARAGLSSIAAAAGDGGARTYGSCRRRDPYRARPC
jgi:hypothetical protein